MAAFEKKVEDLRNESEVDFEEGLTSSQAQERLTKYGRNQFEEAKKDSLVKKFLYSLTDFTTIILLVAAAISFYTAIATDRSMGPPPNICGRNILSVN